MKSTAAQRQAVDITKSIWVAASAGSGKTTVLTGRVLALLLSGVQESEILCITYTKTAANEMKNKLRSKLCRWAYLSDAELRDELLDITSGPISSEQLSQARTLFARVLDSEDGLKIMSFHAFCQLIIKRFPFEAGVIPQFDVIDEQRSDELLREAKQQFLQEVFTANVLWQTTPVQVVGRQIPRPPHITHDFWQPNGSLLQLSSWQAMGILAGNLSETGLEELLKDTLQQRKKLPHLQQEDGFLEYQQQLLRHLGLQPEDLERNLGQELRAGIPRQALEECWEPMLGCKSHKKLEAKLGAILELLKKKNPWTSEELQEYQQLFVSLLDGAFTKDPAMESIKTLMLRERERVCAVASVYNRLQIFAASSALMQVAARILSIYNANKWQHNLLDFDDLIIRANELFNNAEFCNWVLYKIDAGINHILIDEAQDTNEFQWQIVDGIAQEFFAGYGQQGETKRTLFVVGDDKQSIYGFQGANPEIFSQKFQEYYQRYNLQADEQAIVQVNLDISFRSRQTILDLVDLVFSGEAERRAISRINQETIKHTAQRAGRGLVEVWPLISDDGPSATPEASKSMEIKWELEQLWQQPPLKPVNRTAENIAKLIHQWIRGTKPKQNLETGRPLEYRDIMILLKQRKYLGVYLYYLNKYHIPNSGADSFFLKNSLIFHDVLALCKFILFAQDDLNLACLLKSPMFEWTEEQLYNLTAQRGVDEHLIDVLARESMYHRIYNQLQEYVWHQQTSLNLTEFFIRIFEILPIRRQLQTHFSLLVDAFVENFINIVDSYEQDHPHASLESLVEFLSQNSTKITNKVDLNTHNCVTITTIHSAKGLEAPIVILPDTMHGKNNIFYDSGENTKLNCSEDGLAVWYANQKDESVSVDKMVEDEKVYQEYLRQLYVALTRARDELYIMGYGHPRKNSNDGYRSWYQLITDKIREAGREEWLKTQKDIDEMALPTVAMVPASEVEATGEMELQTEDVPSMVLLQQETSEFINPSRSHKFLHYDIERERAIWRGNVTHKMLEILPTFLPEEWDGVLEDYLNLPWPYVVTEEEKYRIKTAIVSVLRKPEFQYFWGENSRAEVPIIGRLGTKIVSGQVDRMVVETNRVVVIDYKSSVADDFYLPRYKQQLEEYRQILQHIYLEKQIQCYVIWTDKQEIFAI